MSKPPMLEFTKMFETAGTAKCGWWR